MQYLHIANATRSSVLCPKAMVADTSAARLFGLLCRAPLGREEGLLLRPSSGVHTWGMRFAIDIVALGRDNCVVGLWREVGPWRVRGLSLRIRSVLELAPGTIDGSGTEAGDQLTMTAWEP